MQNASVRLHHHVDSNETNLRVNNLQPRAWEIRKPWQIDSAIAEASNGLWSAGHGYQMEMLCSLGT